MCERNPYCPFSGSCEAKHDARIHWIINLLLMLSARHATHGLYEFKTKQLVVYY